MKVRCLIELNQAIEKDYAWRIIELSNYRSSLNSEKNVKAQKAKLRAGVALLYSHWEGFVKHICDLYYQYVRFQGLNLSELNDTFYAISLKNSLNTFKETKKLKLYKEFIKSIINGSENKAILSSSNPIKTANLSYDIFEDICILIGIEMTEFEVRYKRGFDRSIRLTIDEDLVNRRNCIAHGEYLPIDLNEFMKLYDIIVNGFLFNIKEIVMDSAQNKKYLRNSH